MGGRRGCKTAQRRPPARRPLPGPPGPQGAPRPPPGRFPAGRRRAGRVAGGSAAESRPRAHASAAGFAQQVEDAGRWGSRPEPGAPDGRALRGCPGEPRRLSPLVGLGGRCRNKRVFRGRAHTAGGTHRGKRCVCAPAWGPRVGGEGSPRHFPDFMEVPKRQKLCLGASYEKSLD